ncbi:Probable dolichyl-diphosphooligosaccharide--protein glycosyltransferase subunit 3B [Ancistrocladus abbreviatus]
MTPLLKSYHHLLFLSLILSFSSLPTSTKSQSDSDIVSELLTLQSQSKSGVVHLTDTLLRRILTPPNRSFSFIIFFDAVHLHDNSELRLSTLKSEFSIAASSFITNNKDTPLVSKLFFFDIEFKESQHSFSLFGVSSLPHIRLVNPDVEDLKNSDKLDQGDFSRLAESMAEFIESRTKIPVGPIHRPPMFSTKQILFLMLGLTIWAPFAIKKILAGHTLLHDRKFWLCGAIFVYFFSVSGTMFNIIRKMPMFVADRSDPPKLVFFYQGSGMQLGAEGFAVGFLYTVVGLLLAFMTHGVDKIRNVMAQRILMVVAMIISFWAVQKVVYLDNWKTGYGIHAYWPSSWH